MSTKPLEDKLATQSHTAVLLVDYQEPYALSIPFWERNKVLENTARMVSAAKSHGLPIWVASMFRRGEVLASIREITYPYGQTHKLPKQRGSAFYGTELLDGLYDEGIRKLVMAGFYTAGCVLDSAEDALKLGFSVVASDGLMADMPSRRNLGEVEKWYKSHCEYYPVGVMCQNPLMKVLGAISTMPGLWAYKDWENCRQYL